MYANTGKKMLNILILKILQEHSDSEHLLTQRDIISRLYQDYGITCEHYSVWNNIRALKEVG